jgi:hypothetical protein
MPCTILDPFMNELGFTPRSTAHLAALAAVACATLTTAAGVLLPQRALAQAACTEIENDSERLACYDRALRPARAAPAEAPRAAAAPRAPVAAAPAPSAAATPPTNRELGTARSVDQRKARDVRAAAAAAAAPPAAPSAAGAPASASAQDAGIVPIVIVNVRALPGRNDRVFTTDGGVIWVQTDNAKLAFPETPFDAQIKPGAMGSYFLVTNERNRAIRVRRQN